MIGEETDRQLGRALEGMIDTLASGKEFVLEQAPLICQEYITYTLIDAIVSMAIQLVVIIALGVLVSRNIKAGKKDKWKSPQYTGIAVFGSIFLVLSVAIAIGGTEGTGLTAEPAYKRAVKAKVAPRVLLLEKAAEMLKSDRSGSRITINQH